MKVLKFALLVIILTECVYTAKARGICGFAKRYPCKERGGPVCCTTSACKSQISTNTTKPSQVATSATTVSSSTHTDCLDVYNNGETKSGVYKIKPTTWSGSPFEVYCNMTDGAGWTVFQRRVDGSVDFHLDWDDYKNGFGSADHELWLGNEKIFSITNQRRYELRIDLVDRYGAHCYAKYNSFRIDNETNNYRLTLGTYSDGDAGDSLNYNQGQGFTTRDRDNDGYYENCAYQYQCLSANCREEVYQGPWWYGHCTYVALNNRYGECCFEWRQLPNNFHIRYTEMKLRPT